jgi:hypothetical protein
MTAPAIRLTEICHYCRVARSIGDVMHLPGGVRLCQGCYQKHCEALKVLSGSPPKECSECHVSIDELQQGTNKPVPMALHYENGLYKLMCLLCSERYVIKRLDLYGRTQYGWETKLV